jgi:two-component system aerobic respiration control sensor histidine kinase ArcB
MASAQSCSCFLIAFRYNARFATTKQTIASMDEKDKEIDLLKNQVAALQKIINLMPGNVYWKDRQGRYLGCNQNNAAATGFKSSADFIGKTLSELTDRKYAESIEKIDDEIMEKNQERTLEEHGRDIPGNPAIYLTRKIPLHDEQDNVIGLLGISFDITEQKRLEEEIRLIREKEKSEEIFSLRKIIALMPGNVYWKNKSGQYVGYNDNFLKIVRHLLKTTTTEIIGKTDVEILGKPAGETIVKVDQKVIETNTEWVMEENALNIDGQPAIYLSRKIPLQNSAGEIAGILGVSIDITDRKRMEEELKIAKEKAEAASRAKSQFLSITSHELRTPLTGIIGMANFLESGTLTPVEEEEYAKHILAAGKHLLAIVNDILDFAKLEADKFELVATPVDLKALIEEATMMLTATAKNKGLTLLIDYAATVPHRILGDSRALRQIIVNLVGNAIKFTAQGNVAIHVYCLQHDAKSAQLEIAVADTGVGIPEEQRELIFERFKQIESAYNRTQGGTGLGLSITKKLVGLMNGEITVKSEIDKGSTFSCVITFPLQEQAILESPWARYEANTRILVIDDTTRGEVTCKHISPAHCQTCTGDEALNNLLSAQQLNHPYDVIIIDKELASMDPFYLLRAIQLQKTLHQPLSLLLVSDASNVEKQTAIAHGFFDVLLKSHQPTTLQTALTVAWEKWSERRNK